MKQIVLISPLDAIEIFKQLGFDTLVSESATEIEAYIRANIASVKVFVYDLKLSDIIRPLKDEYKNNAFPIFLSLAFDENQIEASLMEANRQIENAVGVKID
jgi:hypothetical protein